MNTKNPSSRVRWFEEARFGMFIHFGLYSIPAGVWQGQTMGRNWYAEWMQTQGNWPYGIPAADYQALTQEFNPTNFDAEAWAGAARDAGMRYMVLTTKHHDGFALWPSGVSKFNCADATPFGRDIVGELASACRKFGLKFGCYYSHWLDWEHAQGGRPHEDEFFSEPRYTQPGYDEFEIYWQEKCLPQVIELIEHYDPALFWFDTWNANSSANIDARRIEELIGTVRAKSPECLVNSRIGTWGHPQGNAVVDFISMGDNQFPKERQAQAWETSGTMQRSWGYHQRDYAWEPTEKMLRHLINNAARGGNYQLNVGPMSNGQFAPPAVRRLREIGAWLGAHEEAIFGAQPNPLGEHDWGQITQRTLANGSQRLYLHIFEASPNAEIALINAPWQPQSARILETGQPVSWAAVGEKLIFTLPAELTGGLQVVAIDG